MLFCQSSFRINIVRSMLLFRCPLAWAACQSCHLTEHHAPIGGPAPTAGGRGGCALRQRTARGGLASRRGARRRRRGFEGPALFC